MFNCGDSFPGVRTPVEIRRPFTVSGPVVSERSWCADAPQPSETKQRVISLVEFLAPVKDRPHRDKVLTVLYYREHYGKAESLTVEEIRISLGQARVRGWKRINVADVLSKSGHLVDTAEVRGSKRLWHLTPSGEAHVRSLLDLPATQLEIEHDVSTLSTRAAKISDSTIRSYVDEAIKCLRAGALRASVVFLWTGAIRTLQEVLLRTQSASLNASIQKHDPKARVVRGLDDFSYIKDSVTLLAAQELGVLDKGQKQTLEEALNLRNRCGHPTRYAPGEKKVASFVEDLITIVFP